MMCSFCGENKEKFACSEQGDRLVAICDSCIPWAEQQVDPRGPNPLAVLFPDLDKEEDDEKTAPQCHPVNPEIWEAIYPNHPPDAICLDCGRPFDDESQIHEIWKDDGCHFTLNTEENRLRRARGEVRLLLDRGMTPDEIVIVVQQTCLVLDGKVPEVKVYSMTPTKIGILVGAGIGLFIGLGIWFAGISWYNDAVVVEEATKAQYRDNQNEYDAFWKKVKEAAQVPDKYKDDFKSLLVAETTAKFGPEGSKAQMQWFADRQINFDAGLYKKIQDLIESGHDDFKRSQTMLLDKQRAFGVQMRNYWGSMWAKHYDMPHSLTGDLAPPKDLDGDGRLTVLDYPIVTSAKTQAAFQTGQDEALNVFDKK